MSFDPDMSYMQSLKHVTKGLIQLPTSLDDLCEAWDAILSILYITSGFVIRLILLLTLPLSAPLITLVIQAHRRKLSRATLAAKAEMRARIFDKGAKNELQY